MIGEKAADMVLAMRPDRATAWSAILFTVMAEETGATST